MATNNRERVGRGLELLAEGLEPVIATALAEKVPPGSDWTVLLQALDARRGRTGNAAYDRNDVQLHLRAITERLADNWYPFDGVLARAESALASELRDTRNRWAHNAPFSGEDTYRALDSAERLLRAVAAVDQANAVRTIRLDFQRTEVRGQINKEARTHTSLAGLDSPDLPAWRTVLRPHPDIETGNYAASEFAADLHDVAEGNAEPEYGDPAEFFRRTYLTDGLKELLTRAVARIEGDTNADPVINLQTNFGGGKTHSMLAVWHLVSGITPQNLPQEYAEILGDVDTSRWGSRVRRAALVGTQLSAGQPIDKRGGPTIHTIWGELAWQLGGAEAYRRIEQADLTATNPGAHLKALIADMAPCVILIDEWVAYARDLYGKDDLPGGTFDTQFTFAQSLTEAVKSTSGALLLVSIPASDSRIDDETESSALEIGGAHGRQALERLQNVVSRTAYEWRPASSRESFEIVRRRLFRDPDGDASIRIASVAKAFGQFYQRHLNEFPRETVEPSYEHRIRDAYPIHPELFDRLYSDWSSLPRFQRTRGVLRLMSAVVHSLERAGDPSPLIMPGSIPLDSLGVRDEVAKYLDDNWKPIVETDVDGEGATPVRIDSERPLFGKRHLTQRIARALFLGSAATLHSAHKGIERRRLFLGVAQPGDTVGNFGSALQMLSDRATFLYSDSDRFWYDTQPSLNRRVTEHADATAPEEVWARLTELLRDDSRTRGDFTDVLTAPVGTAEVGEPEGAVLVLLHPRLRHAGKAGADSEAKRFASRLFTERGSAPRDRRNLLVALAADINRAEELEHAVRQHEAWKHIHGRTDLDLTDSNKAMIRRRVLELERTVADRLAQTYIWAMYPEQPDGSRPAGVHSVKIDASAEKRLAEKVSHRLRRDDQLVEIFGARTLRLVLDNQLKSVWEKGHVPFGELWAWFTKHPYLPRLRHRRVLEETVRAGLDVLLWESDSFALATGVEGETYLGLVPPGADASFGPVVDSTLLVRPLEAKVQLAKEKAEREVLDKERLRTAGGLAAPDADNAPALDGHEAPVDNGRQPPATPARRIRNAMYQARAEIDAGKDIERQLVDLACELLRPLDASASELRVTIEIRAQNPNGFDDTTVRIVRENGPNLGLTSAEFKDL